MVTATANISAVREARWLEQKLPFVHTGIDQQLECHRSALSLVQVDIEF